MGIVILLLVLLIVIAEGAAMGCIRMSSVRMNHIYFAFGVVLYVLVAVLLKKSFDIKGMAIVNTLWSALSVITVAGIGCVYFGEQLTRCEVVGVCLAAISAGLMARAE